MPRIVTWHPVESGGRRCACGAAAVGYFIWGSGQASDKCETCRQNIISQMDFPFVVVKGKEIVYSRSQEEIAYYIAECV